MNIYNAGNRIVNTYMYPISDGYVMIDTGYENGYKSFCKKIKKYGIPLKDIKYLFLTHAHDDHAGFLNELLSNAPWLKVIASNKARTVLAKGQNSFEGGCSGLFAYLFCQLMKLFGKGQHLFPAIEEPYWDRFIEVTSSNKHELEKILQGKIIETPGHTSDSISLLTKEGILFCGDAAMNGIPSIHRITIWIENVKEYKNSWEILISQNAKYIYPSHGKPFKDNDLKVNMCHIERVRLYKLSFSMEG